MMQISNEQTFFRTFSLSTKLKLKFIKKKKILLIYIFYLVSYPAGYPVAGYPAKSVSGTTLLFFRLLRQYNKLICESGSESIRLTSFFKW